MTRTVYVVPHTHWDREWYMPLELFRWRLTQMVDALLEHLERTPEYPCFNLDGQSIVIDDYLALRPESRERLTKLIREGRVVIGPWWVQPDEWLPSAESHVRNLQLGIREAEALGGCMMIGHCADQFGHIAQLPQIFSQLELTSACLWRGVSDDVPGWSFWWEAPDATRLPVLYLRQSYSNGVNLPEDPAELLHRVREAEPGRRDEEPLLLMNGSDHTFFEADVPRILKGLGDGYRPQIGTLVDYERAMFAAGIDEYVHTGELRSTNRSNILVGTLSARMNIKQRDFDVSAALERYAEPLEFLANGIAGYDGLAALKFAWRILLENAPHDSICGCSIDQTHREMLPRYDRAEQLANRVADEAIMALAPRLAAGPGSLVAWRPATGQAAPFIASVPAEWAQTGFTLGGAQVPAAAGVPSGGETLSDRLISARAALRQLDSLVKGTAHGRRVQSVGVDGVDDELRLLVVVGDGIAHIDHQAARRPLQAVAPETPVRYSVCTQAVVEVTGVLPPVPSIEVEVLTVDREAQAAEGPATATGDSIENEFYRVRFNRDGVDIEDVASGWSCPSQNQYAVEGDRGDEYNADITGDIIARRHSAFLAVDANGVRAKLTYLTRLTVTSRLTDKRDGRVGEADINVSTTVTVWSGVRRIDFDVEVDNGAEDMRLRSLFPLPFRIETVAAEGHFFVNERSIEPQPWNGRSAEQPAGTLPQKTFAAMERDQHGVAVFNRGLPEAEIIETGAGQAYALTLLRAVGWLSRPDLETRTGDAGPTIRTYDSQMPGRYRFHYAWTDYAGTWQRAGIQAMAHAFAFPPRIWAVSGFDGDQSRIAAATIDGAVFSALHRSHLDGRPVLRVYRGEAAPGDARFVLPARASTVERTNLLERKPKPADATGPGQWQASLRPWEIATFRLVE